MIFLLGKWMTPQQAEALLKRIRREITFEANQAIAVFSANRITLSRSLLRAFCDCIVTQILAQVQAEIEDGTCPELQKADESLVQVHQDPLCQRQNDKDYHEKYNQATRRITFRASTQIVEPTVLNGITFTSAETTVNLCSPCYHIVKRDPTLTIVHVDSLL